MSEVRRQLSDVRRQLAEIGDKQLTTEKLKTLATLAI